MARTFNGQHRVLRLINSETKAVINERPYRHGVNETSPLHQELEKIRNEWIASRALGDDVQLEIIDAVYHRR